MSIPTPQVAAEPRFNLRRLLRISPTTSVWRWMFWAGVSIMVLWVLVPIALLMINAVSTPAQVNGWPKTLTPGFHTDTLMFFWNYQGVITALINSLLAAVFTMVIAIALGAPAGYALARFVFPGMHAYKMIIVMTRAFPMPLLALPLAVIFIQVGIDDSLIGLAFVHATLALPFAVLITSSLFMGIPVELEEAAWTMGCTRWQAFRKVVLPLAAPGIAASAVFAFVISWNEVFASAILTVQNRTLTAFLVQSLAESPAEIKFAGGLVLVVPALLFLFAIRKYLFSMWGIANR
ncbi:carbohydrate ABC transporter permease [Marinobacterium rhizophilum]|uniref:Carbohydrate ABC transporter permease n=1 Tax=Marinobacterium rhizophilum TaxID=420402 RepID=A0ABY5HGW5_9GAMM|nr:carbohydrate ABC transporter permease [Marinobacterium rhizophilum]UTW11219.1 carbohydrate ABC transporter permease [Marinobacterium rhizophilum]